MAGSSKARHGMVGSMGQVASAADNAAMESFFSLLQKNVLDRSGGALARKSGSRS
jgi:putative transposase